MLSLPQGWLGVIYANHPKDFSTPLPPAESDAPVPPSGVNRRKGGWGPTVLPLIVSSAELETSPRKPPVLSCGCPGAATRGVWVLVPSFQAAGVRLLQEWGLLRGSRVGSCLTLGNEFSEETHMLTKQETLLGGGARVESSKVREPRRTALPRGSQSWVLW